MPTDTQELQDLEELFDSKRPCESIREKCEQAAEWLAIPTDKDFIQQGGQRVRDQCLCDYHKNFLIRIHYSHYGKLRVRFVPLNG